MIALFVIYFFRELEIEVSGSNRKSETEIMITKPKVTTETNDIALEETKETETDVDAKENDIKEVIVQESCSSNNIVSAALPPPEMFEIRNSPPLPSAGNKKLKKLIEKNKK